MKSWRNRKHEQTNYVQGNESVIKKPPNRGKKTRKLDGFTGEFYQIIKEELMSIPSIYFKKKKKTEE